MKLGQNVFPDKSPEEFENGACRVETKPLGQMLEEPCVCSIGHIFSQIIMELGQNFYLDISDEYENGSYRVKN